jgi:hypothetical protein
MMYDEFFTMPESNFYNDHRNSRAAERVFLFLQEPEIVARMIQANGQDRPPLEAVIEEVEAHDGPYFDLTNDHNLRNALGSFVKYALAPFGYVPGIEKKLHKGSIITAATHYSFDSERVTKRLLTKTVIEDC